MRNPKDLLLQAERCRIVADYSRMPAVSQRLRALAQRYREQAQQIERQTATQQIAPQQASDAAPVVVSPQ